MVHLPDRRPRRVRLPPPLTPVPARVGARPANPPNPLIPSLTDSCINNAIGRSKKWKIGLPDAGAQEGGGASDPRERRGEMSEQLVEIIGPPVREAAFGQAPHPFVRIELGRIGREVLEVQARELAAEITNRIALVNPALVPEHDDVAAQVGAGGGGGTRTREGV